MRPATYICDVTGLPVYKWTVSLRSGPHEESYQRIKAHHPRAALHSIIRDLRDAEEAADEPLVDVYVLETWGARCERFAIRYSCPGVYGPLDRYEYEGDGWRTCAVAAPEYQPPEEVTR